MFLHASVTLDVKPVHQHIAEDCSMTLHKLPLKQLNKNEKEHIAHRWNSCKTVLKDGSNKGKMDTSNIHDNYVHDLARYL